MEYYGCTIRNIRLNKGFSQKEIYTGILSKSFAIDFEKGKYDIKFSLMLEILKRLMISVDELLLIHNQYESVLVNEPLMNINLEQLKNNAKYAQKVEEDACQENKEHKSISNKLKYMEILALKSLYKTPEYQKSQEYQTAKKYIQRYLFDIETWTFAEFRIFSDMSFMFNDGDVKTSLFLNAWKSLEKCKQHPDFSIYLSHLLVNNLYGLLYSGQYEIAEKAIKRLSELTDDINMLSWRVPLLYYEGLLCYIKDDKKQGLEIIEKAKTIYALSGHSFMTEQMDTGLEAIKQQETQEYRER